MFGVEVQAPGVTIGGTNGTSATICAGDCDLLSGNSTSEVVFEGDASGKVIGDTIGPDLTGTKVLRWLAAPCCVKRYGLVSVGPESKSVPQPGMVIVGGATSAPGMAPGNVIAGGALGVLMDGSAGVVAGNLIGLDRRGTASLEGRLTTGGSNFPYHYPPALPTSVYSGVLAEVDTVIGGGWQPRRT